MENLFFYVITYFLEVPEYIKQVESLLDKMGYDVEQKMYSSTESGPIDGTIVCIPSHLERTQCGVSDPGITSPISKEREIEHPCSQRIPK